MVMNQPRVAAWVREVFTNAEAEDVPERALRMAEEALELAQACNVDAEILHRLVDYVFSRPVGAPEKEIAGTMVTVYALAAALGADAQAEFETELLRIQQPEVIERCRRRQHEKRAVLSGLHAPFIKALAETRPITEALSSAASEILENAIDSACLYSSDATREPEPEAHRELTPFERPKKRPR